MDDNNLNQENTPLKMAFGAIGFALAIVVIMRYGKGKGFWYGAGLWVLINMSVAALYYIISGFQKNN